MCIMQSGMWYMITELLYDNTNIVSLGYKIPVIENMGATLDQFDTIDLSDNEIRKLDGFPLLRRLKCLMINNNRVV